MKWHEKFLGWGERTGYLYVVEINDGYKIGITVNPKQRFKNLQQSIPPWIKVIPKIIYQYKKESLARLIEKQFKTEKTELLIFNTEYIKQNVSLKEIIDNIKKLNKRLNKKFKIHKSLSTIPEMEYRDGGHPPKGYKKP